MLYGLSMLLLLGAATTCIATLSIRLTMQKNLLRNPAINSFFYYVSRILRATLQAVQLRSLG